METAPLPRATRSAGSMVTAYVLTINVVFGSGVLAMPHAIQQSGFLLGEGMLAVVSVVAWITVMWTVESIARLKFIEAMWENHEVLQVDDDDEEDETVPLHPGNSNFHPAMTQKLVPSVDIQKGVQLTTDTVNRGFEVNQLCLAFLGKRWAQSYDACLTVYTWAVMWLYVTVWCRAFVTIIPVYHLTHFNECSTPFHGDCLTSYRIFVSVFAATMSILCLGEWKAFERIQRFFTLFAYICLVIMLVSIIYGINHVPYQDPDDNIASDRDSAPYWGKGNKLADFGTFGSLFGTCIFSQMAHQGTAQILTAMNKKNHAGRLFAFAFTTTALFYTVLAVAASLYFGEYTKDIVTLNWQSYTTNSQHKSNGFTKALFAIIVTFPVGTTSAAYMFFVKTIGEQLECWVPSSTKEQHPKWLIKLACRIIAFTPPIIGGLVEDDVKTIVSVAGFFGFFIMFFFPSMLQLSSVRTLQKLGKPTETPFTWLHSSVPAVYTLIALGGAGIIFYVYTIFA